MASRRFSSVVYWARFSARRWCNGLDALLLRRCFAGSRPRLFLSLGIFRQLTSWGWSHSRGMNSSTELSSPPDSCSGGLSFGRGRVSLVVRDGRSFCTFSWRRYRVTRYLHFSPFVIASCTQKARNARSEEHTSELQSPD